MKARECMIIENNESTMGFYKLFSNEVQKEVFLNECYKKIDYTTVTKEEEKEIVRTCKEVDSRVKGFKRSANTLLKNPYIQNIKLDDINFDDVSYKSKTMPARTLFIADFPVLKSQYGFFETTMGYYDRNVTFPMLKENSTLWMSITEMEINTARDAIEKAHGDVLTFGLGLGYFPYMCSLKDSVDSITIVELNPKVIKMFNEYILPQFEYKDKIKIIQGDMYDYLKDDFLNKFDYKFADIWKGDKDGTSHYIKMLKTNCNLDNFDFWIEDALLKPVIMCMGMCFITMIFNTEEKLLEKRSQDGTSNELDMFYLKILKHFTKINKVITTKEELGAMILDRKLIREILRS